MLLKVTEESISAPRTYILRITLLKTTATVKTIADNVVIIHAMKTDEERDKAFRIVEFAKIVFF